MDIKLPHSALTKFLETNASPKDIAKALSLCGPTVDKLEKIDADWLYHLEIITNRVDTAGALGVAREAAAILPEFNFKAALIHDPYQKQELAVSKALPSPVKVTITKPSLAPRFSCIALQNVTVKESPTETKKLLTLSGQRPLNNVIDITNELTLLYGQPVHVFDVDLIKKQIMIVRESQKGEKITTLDNQTHVLKGGDIVIEDGEGRLIDLCGVMGGKLSAVSHKTKSVLLFVQTYDPKKIRATSLYTQKRTLAAQLFEKQTDPDLVLPVLSEGISLLAKHANARVSSSLLDLYPNPLESKTIDLDLNWLSHYAGISVNPTHASQILNRLGFKVAINKETASVKIPSWRATDIHLKEDLSEEIMRVYGYYKLPSHLPQTTITHIHQDKLLDDETTTRHYLSGLGFTEIYNYSLISQDLAQKTHTDLKNAYQLDNPLSQDYVYMRPTLLPSLIMNLESNQGLVKPPHHLFELANIYLPSAKKPNERSTLSLITQQPGFHQTKGYLEALAKKLNVTLSFKPAQNPPAPYHPQKTAVLLAEQAPLGFIGELDPAIAANFGLEETVIISEINFQTLSQYINPIHHFKPVPCIPLSSKI
jgi:phenylalanyl-tRNA synthetase beta chain